MTTNPDILHGWDAIIAYLRKPCNPRTILKKGYPVYRDVDGAIWARAEELDAHRIKISQVVDIGEAAK